MRHRNHWFLDDSSQRALLNLGVSAAHQTEAFEELMRVFPLEWLQTQVANTGLVGHRQWLHAPVGSASSAQHPVPQIMLARAHDHWMLAELFRLADDLFQIRSLTGAPRLTQRLQYLDEYPGALFEVEVLSALLRADLKPEIIATVRGEPTPDLRFMQNGRSFQIENAVRGMPFALLVMNQFFQNLVSLEFGHLRLEFSPSFGGSGENVHQMAALLTAQAVELINGGHANASEMGWTLSHDASGSERTLTTSWGGTPGFRAKISGHVRGILLSKARQLAQTNASRSIITLDTRSLIPGDVPSLHPFHLETRDAVVEGIRDGLDDEPLIAAVLLWRRPSAGLTMTLQRAVAWPDEIQVYVRDRSLVAVNDRREMYDALAALP